MVTQHKQQIKTTGDISLSETPCGDKTCYRGTMGDWNYQIFDCHRGIVLAVPGEAAVSALPEGPAKP